MQRRYWSAQEDQALRYIVEGMDETNWTMVSLRLRISVAGSDRNAKQCRERWLNKLTREGSDDLPWTSNDDKIILSQFLKHYKSEKNKWISISEKINQISCSPDSKLERSPNGIKNRFYSVIRKGIRRINNKLKRPFLPQEIRLIRPVVTAKLLETMEETERKQFLQIIYNMASDFPELNSFSQEMSSEKLESILKSIMELSRAQKRLSSESSEKIRPIKKRKSSLSTLEESKLDQLNKFQPVVKQQENYEHDIVSLFIGNFIQDSVSLEFQEVNFGF